MGNPGIERRRIATWIALARRFWRPRRPPRPTLTTPFTLRPGGMKAPSGC